MTKIRVRALPKQGFFRAGRHWPATATEVDVDDQTLAKLDAEPRLQVERVEAPEPKTPPKVPDGTPIPVKQEPKTPPKVPDGTPISVDFPGKAHLEAAGLTTLEAVNALTDDELLAMKGIGDGTVAKIREALKPSDKVSR